jgi:HSP20 family protein
MEWKSLTPWNWMQREQTASKANPLALARTGWPSSPLIGLQHEIDRLFSDAMRGFGMHTWPESRQLESQLFRPKLEITENDKTYTVRVEMPGVQRENVEVTVSEDCLTISGEKKEIHEHEEGHRHYSERSFGRFQRQLALPSDADENSLQAQFEDGVLSITLARKPGEASKIRKIEIH